MIHAAYNDYINSMHFYKIHCKHFSSVLLCLVPKILHADKGYDGKRQKDLFWHQQPGGICNRTLSYLLFMNCYKYWSSYKVLQVPSAIMLLVQSCQDGVRGIKEGRGPAYEGTSPADEVLRCIQRNPTERPGRSWWTACALQYIIQK